MMKVLKKWILLKILLISLFVPSLAYSLTLDDAISLAKENLPSYKASSFKIKSTEALYDASLSPYIPTLDVSAIHRKYYTSEDFSPRTYNLTLSYTLFDGGKRRANRNIASLNLDTDKEGLRKNLIELWYDVKVAFYTVIAQRELLEQRRIQLEDARKDYEVAEGRYKFGVARLSDVLLSSVRLEQAKFNLVQAEGDFRKAFSELNSLIGRYLESQYDLIGTLDIEIKLPDLNKLSQAVLQKPEVRQAENLIRISENNKSLAQSAFYPALSMSALYNKTGGGVRPSSTEEKIIGITATWNIFELGKFFRQRASEYEIDVSRERLNDIKRQLLLNVHKTYEDVITASNKLKVAEQQLKQAEHNYEQAFGEYKVGKGDILSLVQAESQLANAREQLIASRLNLLLSKSLLERTAGVERLEEITARQEGL